MQPREHWYRHASALGVAARLGTARALCLFLLAAQPTYAVTRNVFVPVSFDQPFVSRLITETVYKDGDGVAVIWDDGSGCNYLRLSDPVVAISSHGVSITSQGVGRVGTAVGARCLLIQDWKGQVRVLERAVLADDGSHVRFEVADSALHRADGSRDLHSVLWDWVKKYLHPHLETVRIDLRPALEQIRAFVAALAPPGSTAEQAAAIVDSVGLTQLRADEGVLTASLALAVPIAPAAPAVPEPPLSPDELNAFAAALDRLDAFITFVVKAAALATENDERREALLLALIDARYQLLDAVNRPVGGGGDPVRLLFLQTWDRLAPLLRDISHDAPIPSAMQFLSFIAAADALRAIDELGPSVDVQISADALRRLARMLVPDGSDDPLRLDPAVDPSLRELFDFGDPLPLPSIDPRSAWDGLLGSAWAADAPPEFKRLNRWVPTRNELDEYLQLVRRLLHRTVDTVLKKSPIEAVHQRLFRAAVLATAWQETCWRHYVQRDGKTVTIRSPTGAVGMMQVVPAVWRGFYDARSLAEDIGYNTAAGGEILRHYLVRYAIPRGEHTASGNPDYLARATYAAYNGGPSHLTRYRDSGTPPRLRRIDQAFWDKYQRVKNGDELGVADCYRARATHDT